MGTAPSGQRRRDADMVSPPPPTPAGHSSAERPRLPEIIRAAAEPIASIDTLTVVSTDGASAMTKTVGQVLGEGTEVVESLTGLDVISILAGLAGGRRGRGLRLRRPSHLPIGNHHAGGMNSRRRAAWESLPSLGFRWASRG